MKKIAVVTGGVSGIGRETASSLKQEGWEVWCLDTTVPGAESQLGVNGQLTGVSYIRCDVSNEESVATAFELLSQKVKNIDALIHSAGVLRTGSLEDHESAQVDLLMRVNIKGPWLVLRAALALLRKNATPENPTRVVFVGSISGLRPKVGAGFYGATKAALHVLTQVFAVELAESSILVNAVAPGTVATPMIASTSQAAGATHYKPSGASPLGRIANPDDIAKVIMFFLGEDAKYVTGTVLPVDGGTRAAFQVT